MSIGLTAKELTSIRNDIDDLLPDTGYIIAITNTPDGQGGQTVSTAVTAGGTVSCRLDGRMINMLKGGESVAGAALVSFQQFILTLPYNTTITTNNQFLKDGQLYNITSVDTDKSWKASVRCILERT